MTTILPPSKRLLLASITVIFGVALAVFLTWATLPSVWPGPVKVVRVGGHSVFDVRDDGKLVNFADHVFFGQVLEKGRTIKTDGMLKTSFTVRVQEALKGSANGTVTVKQAGGYSWIDHALILRGNDEPLEPGKSYLFVTRSRSQVGSHTFVTEYGDIELRVPPYANDDEVLSSQHAGELRERFLDAIEHETPYLSTP